MLLNSLTPILDLGTIDLQEKELKPPPNILRKCNSFLVRSLIILRKCDSSIHRLGGASYKRREGADVSEEGLIIQYNTSLVVSFRMEASKLAWNRIVFIIHPDPNGLEAHSLNYNLPLLAPSSCRGRDAGYVHR